MSEQILEVSGVHAFYGRAQALFDVSLTVSAGEAIALVGRNGAGKSTLLKTIIGLLRPAGGCIRYANRDVVGLSPHAIARLGVGYVPEERRIFPDLTVAENLEVGRRTLTQTQSAFAGDGAVDILSAVIPASSAIRPWTVPRLLELFPALGDLLTRRGDRLSGGEQQMLAIARTLMGNPRLLLLDEPAEGLAPIVVEQTVAAIRALKAEGLSILLSEQSPAFGDGLADRAYRIDRGRVSPL